MSSSLHALRIGMLWVAACAPSLEAAPAVVVVAPMATEPPRDLAVSPTTATKAPGADCAPGGVVHVTIAPLSNETGRPLAEVEAAVMPVLERQLAQREGLVVTRGEHLAGRCEISLVPVARPFDYAGGSLRVKVSLGVRWRSDGSLIGSVDKTLTKQSVSLDDRASELQLLTMAAELGGQQLAAHVHAFTDPATED
jgi:hypothetical protein